MFLTWAGDGSPSATRYNFKQIVTQKKLKNNKHYILVLSFNYPN